ncbi:MAG: methylenetetrahydrofolate reductase [NAD(P)H], partial [Anaerococcus vaginalis]|nr:methylenetetrahydrofolate reductase [NAD(P)H] [Anaerococcus vaginalis]
MNIGSRNCVLSFEVFPPRKNLPIETIYNTIDRLIDLKPESISVTYGAAGNDTSKRTFDIAGEIKKQGVESVAHLISIGLSEEELTKKLNILKEKNVNKILALRGDIPESSYKKGDYEHASYLIRAIKEKGDFYVMAAAYPEGHIDSLNLVEDIKNLRKKVDAGCDSLVTQLFFDNEDFYRFRDMCDLAGINVPIQAGIMPVINKKQIEKMISLNGIKLPKKILKIMKKYENDKTAMRDCGIAYAVDQIVDLILSGVDGIHLYTMNNPYIAEKIYESIKN